ncbi:MAG: ABC-F family ATP-binding cassette domain-containing protein [Actinomycetota bacterium]
MNLINIEGVTKTYGTTLLLDGVSLGVEEGERIGLVGRNGAGKSTLIRVLTQLESPDEGRVTHRGGLRVGVLQQEVTLPAGATVTEVVLGSRAEHEWAGDKRVRDILDGLLLTSLDTVVDDLSGGERRRVALAALLIGEHDVIVLDEPTNHLDIEAVDWLAGHLAEWRGSLIVVTHDRWFLDAVCTTTWEVADGSVHRYDGGYSVYVLAKAERSRVAAFTEARRQNLLKKELAWLRRGPPARTSKPQFRIDAANALIDDEPPARDELKMVEFATARLGKLVLELTEVGVRYGDKAVLHNVTWQLGPGDRIGVLGPNGAGKSTLLNLLADRLQPTSGSIKRGTTIRVATLEQEPVPVDPEARVLESVEEIAREISVPGKTMTAGQLLERFLFPSSRQWTRVGDLSGGEKRRLQVLRLLIAEPNVLLLDEPTNDLDIETLTALEDYLDGWPGSLVVVSHDRYFLERTCDRMLMVGGGTLRDLPGGVEQYVAVRRSAMAGATSQGVKPLRGGDSRTAKKELTKLERLITKLDTNEAKLHKEMAEKASDYAAIQELDAKLRMLKVERSAAETDWLTLAEELG